MFSVKELIIERQQYTARSLTPGRDGLLESVLDAEQEDEVALIIPGSLLETRRLSKIQQKYNINGVYHIGEVFTNTRVPFYIVHLSKQSTNDLKVALFKGKSYDEKERSYNREGFAVPHQYSEEWNHYVEQLENWMNGGKIPDSSDMYEYKIISKDHLFKGSVRPETYSQENIELRTLLDKQETKELSELADLIIPRPYMRSEEEVKVLGPRDFRYPLDITRIKTSKPTNVVLQKGDVLLSRNGAKSKSYLFDYEGEEQIYASTSTFVIRCTSILPEYLYFYLNSEIALRAINARCVGSFIQFISARDVVDLPVAMPEQDEQKYISDFKAMTQFGIRDYGQLERFKDYHDHLVRIKSSQERPHTIEDILNLELADRIVAYREDQLRSFLSEDLRELNTCFKGKAYKATLILAGSILEAVLIDWLSEIDHKNYFEEEYRIVDKYGHEKRADLIDYINRIKYLKRPNWMDEAAKAHEIRKKRNLVHAKLCLKSEDINEEVCREVISYLSDVLKTRGINTSNNG